MRVRKDDGDGKCIYARRGERVAMRARGRLKICRFLARKVCAEIGAFDVYFMYGRTELILLTMVRIC